jgi:3-phenylpropionate/trans-cinnamate dioxygenase ferredoxin component
MGTFVKVATTDEMTEQPVKCVEVAGKKIALFDVQGEIFALSDTCTHRGGPLSEGELEATTVTCPWHGAQFDVRTGGILGPPATTDVKSYPVRVRGKDIVIEI